MTVLDLVCSATKIPGRRTSWLGAWTAREAKPDELVARVSSREYRRLGLDWSYELLSKSGRP
jgi:hypothetical protein